MYRNKHRGEARTLKGMEMRRKMERLAHGAALQLDVQQAPQDRADWLYDLRRKRLYIYGGLLRFIDTAVEQGKPREFVEQIPEWIAEYIAEQYGPRDPTPVLRRVA